MPAEADSGIALEDPVGAGSARSQSAVDNVLVFHIVDKLCAVVGVPDEMRFESLARFGGYNRQNRILARSNIEVGNYGFGPKFGITPPVERLNRSITSVTRHCR
jgi:hypothetical protein